MITETVNYEAVMTGWCWALVREPDNRWSLRQKDWRTEQLSEPVHISDRPLETTNQAVAWVGQYVPDLMDWQGSDDEMTDPTYQYLRWAMATAAKVQAA